MTKFPACITREKHLDHMVKIVPFIAMVYLMQCYFFTKLNLEMMGQDAMLLMGICMAGMIVAILTYNLKHKVFFYHDYLEIEFLSFKQKINYSEITSIKVPEEDLNFSTLTLTLKSKDSYHIYFVDEAKKIKSWLEEQKAPKEIQVAA